MGLKIVLSELAHKKINHWVNKADFEVSGLGKVVHDPVTDTLRVDDVYLLKQEGTGSHTELEPAAVAKLMYTTREVPGHLSYWWHSHVNMACFWSGQDKETIFELGGQGLCVATVFNKKGEHRSAVCYKADGMLGQRSPWWDEVETMFETSAPPPPAEWDEEFTTNVIEKKYTPTVVSPSVRSLDEDAWARRRGYSATGYFEGYSEIVPYYIRREAELLEMDPDTYWNKMQFGSELTITALEKQIEEACMAKHGLKYDDWCHSLLRMD
jgi:hypothetical protein